MSFRSEFRAAMRRTLVVTRNLIDAAIDYMDQTEEDEPAQHSAEVGGNDTGS